MAYSGRTDNAPGDASCFNCCFESSSGLLSNVVFPDKASKADFNASKLLFPFKTLSNSLS
ncbi:hypothetical protein HanXRQr2_Chr11g0496961 [Helianthus annuus]|uniref:Uncharacterized protein n=1 Tax=Helianthus annuus TaxID=4232 RepID=A0A9K3HQB4_HELAN|nr:hypothetical protein HanXRQr2_Chr11g0496961 [Helianthus annuus]KAJ0875661.1 hypothetical protein HanPSC8_Chr11g0479001 [Helianthus annuus]